MFGANPIPETEIDSSNSTNSSITSHNADVSYSEKVNSNETLETNRMKYLSSVGIFSTSPTLKLELMNTSVTDNLQHEDASSISTTENDFVCAFYNPEYIIYSSLCSFFIPCVFMVFLYSRIFWVSISNCYMSHLDNMYDFTVSYVSNLFYDLYNICNRKFAREPKRQTKRRNQ